MRNFAPKICTFMTAEEYIQLKAFARIDGVSLAIFWTICFACYLVGLSNSLLGWIAVLMVVMTPFYVARRLKNFRDYGREGAISFMRGWGYVAFVFFYASLLFAIVQYVYFAYLDQGYFLSMLRRAMEQPELSQQMSQLNMKETFEAALQSYQETRPIDLALNFLSFNIVMGFVVGLPVAAIMKSERKTE